MQFKKPISVNLFDDRNNLYKSLTRYLLCFPGHQTCGVITLKHVYEIAKIKADEPAYATQSLEQVCNNIIGVAIRMGIKVCAFILLLTFNTSSVMSYAFDQVELQVLLKNKEKKRTV